MAGEPDVGKLLRGITAKQFRGWEHYRELEGLEGDREDLRAAFVVQMLANVNRGKDGHVWTLKDALGLLRGGIRELVDGPAEAPATPRQTPAQQEAMARVWVEAFNNSRPARNAESPEDRARRVEAAQRELDRLGQK